MLMLRRLSIRNLAFALPLALLATSTARAVIVDDFEVGAFGPLTDVTTGDGAEVLVQSDLDPSHVASGRRQIQIELLGGSSVTASLMVNGADDGIVFDLPANATGDFATVYSFLAADFDFTADGGSELVVTAPGLPFAITITAQFAHGPSGEFTFLSQFSSAEDTYVFPFTDFVWSGTEGSFDAVSQFALFLTPQFGSVSPRSLMVSDIRTIPEPSNGFIVDDFEVGAFEPLTDATTGDGAEVLFQTGLDPSHAIDGRRTVQIELLSGSSVTASLIVDGADDGIVYDLPANATGEFATNYNLSADFDFTANGGTELVVTAPGLPSFITLTASFSHGPSGERTSLSQFSSAEDTYVFPFTDFVWNGDQGSFDAISRFTLFVAPQAGSASPRSLMVTDIRTAPEPTRGLFIALALLVALGALRRKTSIRV